MERGTPRVTIMLPADILDEVRLRAGRGGVSAWMAEAAADRLGREALATEIAAYESESGPITSEDIAEARARTEWQPPAKRRTPAA